MPTDSAEQTVEVQAPIKDVLATIRDVESQVEWIPEILEAEVLEVYDDGLPATARFKASATVGTDEYITVTEIADLVLSVNVGAYAIEMANPRHEHEWRVWEELPLPEDKVLIPGVIAHTTNVVEHPELIAERIVRLANVVGRERVLAGTDCGFTQGPYVRRVHPTIMWAKLRSLVEGAQLASTKLWP